MSEEQHLALPHLYGAPAYSRPPRSVEQVARPFDPDELPIEAERTEGELAASTELTGTTWAPVNPPPAKSKGLRRSRAGKAAKGGQATGPGASSPVAASPAPASPRANGSGELQGRPFSLRNLGRLFGGDHK